MTDNFSLKEKMFDSSCISDYMGCPRLFYYVWVRRLEMKEEKPALTFGKAFHEALAEWYRTGEEEKAIEKFAAIPTSIQDDSRTKELGVSIFKEYVKRYAKEVGKTLHLEVKFKVEIEGHCPYCNSDEFKSIEKETEEGDVQCLKCLRVYTRGRLYAGTIDRIEEWNGQVYVDDHKTTKQLGLSFFENYRPHPQMDGYAFACRELVGRCSGVIINGISVAQNPKDRFLRFASSRTEAEIEGWRETFTDVTDDILRDVERGHWRKSTVYCNRWGKCRFWQLCVYGEDEGYVKQNFNVKETKTEGGEK